MNDTAFQTLTYETKNQTAIISLNRPQVLNACNLQMREELTAALQQADADKNIRIKILTGTGKAFCVGQDLAENVITKDKIRAVLEKEYQPILLALDQSPKLTIAAVNGAAAGIGAALAMACDLSIMADDAYLYQAFIAIGLLPDGGLTWQLVQQLGYQRALEMVIDGEKIFADTCVALGLANRQTATVDLLDEAMAWAEQLSEKAPLALHYSKKALKFSRGHSFAEAISCEAEFQEILAGSADAAEGISAFREKRKARFTGN